MRQRIQNRQPSALGGAGLILLVAAAVLLGSAAFSRLAARVGPAASLGFIIYGAAIAWFLMNWFVLAFVYALDGGRLRVCRAYGRRERLMCDVWLNRVRAYGTPEEMRQRFPAARAVRATRPQCPLAPLALAYSDGARDAILVLQPDDDMREALIAALRRR